MTYAQLGNLRLATAYKLYVDTKTGKSSTNILDDGLHLDATSNGGESWYTIAKITYDDESSYYIESIASRLIDTLSADNLDDIKYLCNYALKLFKKLKAEERKEGRTFYWSDEIEEEDEEE